MKAFRSSISVAAVLVGFGLAAPGAAQAPASPGWRVVAPENLLVIDTSKGRIVVELDPVVAPNSVARVRTLADQGFYDGLKFHRVISNFMAQTGDPQGTGQGGSDLPDMAAELQFRRGRDLGFAQVASTPEGQTGQVGSMPVVTQPDAQMMITADFKAGAQGLFCQGVVGMARSGQNVDSANSQFFLMTADRPDLNGQYTPFGRILKGLEVARALKVGEGSNGQVTDPDIMTRVRTAAAMPADDTVTARVAATPGEIYAAHLARARAQVGGSFDVCDAQPPAEVSGA